VLQSSDRTLTSGSERAKHCVCNLPRGDGVLHRFWQIFSLKPSFLLTTPMSDDGSDTSAKWDAFLSRVDTGAVSPEIDQWEAFLASVVTSPRPPAVLVQTSESESTSSNPESPPSSTGDEYHPSPVPEPVLYQPTHCSSPDEGEGDFQRVIGEWPVKLPGTHP